MDKINREKIVKDRVRDAGYKKAAKFLLLIGKEEASKVLGHLSEEEVEGVTAQIARIDEIDRREAEKILEEFGCLVKSKNLVMKGGLEEARKMLISAFGEEKGLAAYDKLRLKTSYRPFSFLEDLDFSQVMMLIGKESEAVAALILTHLSPDLSARVLEAFPEEKQRLIIKRIGHLSKIKPETILQAEDSLKDKVRSVGKIITEEVDGQAALAAILGQLDLRTGQTLLDKLDEQDPELADQLRKRLFNIRVLLRIRDRDLERLLRDFEDREIALILKGKEETVRQKVLQNVSQRRRAMIQLEYDSLGEVRRTDVDRETSEFLDYLRQRVEDGDLALVDDDEAYVE